MSEYVSAAFSVASVPCSYMCDREQYGIYISYMHYIIYSIYPMLQYCTYVRTVLYLYRAVSSVQSNLKARQGKADVDHNI